MSRLLFNVLRSSINAKLRNELRKSDACNSQLRFLSILPKVCTKQPDSTNSKTPNQQKKSKEIPKITLVQQNDSLSVTSLEEAQKLARRRDLQLIKVQDFDPKSQRPVYKLVSAAELLAADFDSFKSSNNNSSSQSKKSEKSLTIGCRISDNDLASRLKNINKWLSKGSVVRILIQCANDDAKNAEKIVQKVEASIREPEVIGKITQKRTKDNFVKFIILPVAKKEPAAAEAEA